VRTKLRDWIRGYTDTDVHNARCKMMYQEPGKLVHMTDAECRAFNDTPFVHSEDDFAFISGNDPKAFGKTTYKDPNWNKNGD
jgi:hypothetical protein